MALGLANWLALGAQGGVSDAPLLNMIPHTDLSHALWSKTASLAVAQEFGYDSQNTAYSITTTTTAAVQFSTSTTQLVARTTGQHTFAVRVRQGSGATDANAFVIRNNTTASDLLSIAVNYTTGAITYVVGASGATMTALADGWWLLRMTVSAGISIGDALKCYLCFAGASQTAGKYAYVQYPSLFIGAVKLPLRRMSGVPAHPLVGGRAKIVYAGDSITQGGGTATSQTWRSYTTWAQTLSRQTCYMPVGGNAGVAGNTSTQLLTRYATDVTALSPSIVCLLIGVNDLASIPAETTISNIAAMLAANAAINARTVITKILPYKTAASPMNATELARWEAVNAYISGLASSTISVVDGEDLLGNVDANHTIIESLFDDTTHPNPRGAYLLGNRVAAVLNGLYGTPDILFTSPLDMRSAVPNGEFAGTPNAWTASDTLLGSSVVRSLVARASHGNWWQQMLSGSVTTGSPLLSVTSANANSGFVAGDIVQAAIEIECDAGANGIIGVTADLLSGWTKGGNIYSPYTAEMPTQAWSGVLVTPPRALTADQTSLPLLMYTYMQRAAGDVACTVRFGRAAVYKI